MGTTLVSKYSVGDKVYRPMTSHKEKFNDCPDCLGEKKWIVNFPNGENIEVGCQTCNSTGCIRYFEYTPSVDKLTIGQIRYEGDQFKYMCNETGIGSGTIYYENLLYSSLEDAEKRAEELTKERVEQQVKNNYKSPEDFNKYLDSKIYARRVDARQRIEIENVVRRLLTK